MKFILTVWFSILFFISSAQSIEGYSEDCMIYLTIENQKTSNVKVIEIQYSVNGYNFISFDELNISPKKEISNYCCVTSNKDNYFRIKTTFVNGNCNFSKPIKIINICHIDEPS